MTQIEDVDWTELVSTAHVLDWNIGERRMGNLKDPETLAMVRAGLLRIVDDELRATIPVVSSSVRRGGGCGCGR